MKKAELYFKIRLPFQSKLFVPLSKLGKHAYDPDRKSYIWMFKIENIKEVLAILGHPFIFSGEDARLVSQYSDNKSGEVEGGAKYGEGFVAVSIDVKKPNHFLVTTVRNKQPQNTYVSFETVRALWRVIKAQPLSKKILTCTVAKNYCDELGITGFNTYNRVDGDNFNWKYFSGSRKHYLVFYSALKVLAHYGVIEHVVQASKSGIVRRSDAWEIQSELKIDVQQEKVVPIAVN